MPKNSHAVLDANDMLKPRNVIENPNMIDNIYTKMTPIQPAAKPPVNGKPIMNNRVKITSICIIVSIEYPIAKEILEIGNESSLAK